MKKLLLSFILLTLALFTVACSGQSESEGDTKEIKIGVSGTDTRVWDFVAEKAKKEGIDIKVVTFSDYVLPNTALADGDLDANSFQTISYFDEFIKDQKVDLVPIGTTIIAPMAIYSDKYTDTADIPDGSKIAVPNDESNMGRALLLLQEAGLIGLAEDFNGLGGLDAIVENPKNLEIIPMVAAQTPRVLPDVAASAINNGVAVDAGFSPTEDSILHENETATPYINIIAARAEDKDDETLKKIVELYQSEDTKKFIEEEYKGNQIPTFVPLENIGW